MTNNINVLFLKSMNPTKYAKIVIYIDIFIKAHPKQESIVTLCIGLLNEVYDINVRGGSRE